jgi:hypothetical protein
MFDIFVAYLPTLPVTKENPVEYARQYTNEESIRKLSYYNLGTNQTLVWKDLVNMDGGPAETRTNHLPNRLLTSVPTVSTDQERKSPPNFPFVFLLKHNLWLALLYSTLKMEAVYTVPRHGEKIQDLNPHQL